MSSRQRGTSRSKNPQQQANLKPYLLPALGVAAILLMVGLVVIILASGGDDNRDDESGLADAGNTPTAASSPEDEAGEETEVPTPTQTAENGEDSDPTPTSTPAAESEDEPEPTSEPEPDPTTAPEPTPVPLVGDFGELPAGDMPSGSPADSLNLEYRLDMSLQALPTEAPVYQIQRPSWTAEGVQQLANQLAIEGELVDQGNGSFQIEGTAASLYVNSSVVQYVRTASPESTPELPANEQLTQMARTWLTQNGLTGADTGQGQVLDRNEESGRAYVQIKPVEPANLISATPSAGVTILGDGTVTEAMVNWPASLQASTYGLRSADQLWNSVTQGRGFVDINAEQLPADFQGRSGTITATGASIAYTIAGSQQGPQYLVPVAVFSGTATIDGVESAIPVEMFIEAVSAQTSPRG